MSDISNMADIIDSRDIIARIEELSDLQEHWVAGWNMPGCLPDTEAQGCCTWEQARDYIAEELARYGEELARYGEELGDSYADEIAAAVKFFTEDISDDRPASYTVAQYAFWIEPNADSAKGLDEYDAQELKALKALASEGESLDDWEHGAQLVRDSYFKTHAQELADDLGLTDKAASWPYTCIDWDQAARELQQDYTSIDYDGVTYWAR